MLELRDVDAAYGAAKIVHGVSLRVERGEVVALLGRNGAGKSTTLKATMGLLRPTGGEVLWDGVNLVGRPPYQICRAGLGYVPEERRIFTELTVLENLQVGWRPAQSGAPTWTVDKLLALFPNLAERRAAAGGTLSGGEQQMLTIARTLMGNPAAVLLDEPSEGIAPIIVEQMAATIKALKGEGLCVLVSEQNLGFARVVADRLYILEKGIVRYTGTVAELDRQPEIREQYLAV